METSTRAQHHFASDRSTALALIAVDDSHHRAAAAVLAPGVPAAHPPLAGTGDPALPPPRPPLAVPVPGAHPLLIRLDLRRHLLEAQAAPHAEAGLRAVAVGATVLPPRLLQTRRRRWRRRVGRHSVAAVRVGPFGVRRPPDRRAD